DPRLVGRQLGEDARVRGVRVQVVLDVGRSAEQLRTALTQVVVGQMAVERRRLALDDVRGLALRRRRGRRRAVLAALDDPEQLPRPLPELRLGILDQLARRLAPGGAPDEPNRGAE